MAEPSPLFRLLREPAAAAGLDGRAWNLVLRHGRAASLLGQLDARLAAAGAPVPSLVRDHLRAARLLADKIARDLRPELGELEAVLAPVGVPVVLLKGAAYVAGGLPPAAGRTFGDLDILVPRAALPAVEARLRAAGWTLAPMDERDHAYYRRWAHELPPLVHPARGTVLDVHHDIVQSRAPAPPARGELWRAAMPLQGCLALPQPVDLVLHAAVHLIDDGEFDKGARDLVDLWALTRHFACDPAFLPALAARAAALGLGRPLRHGLHHADRLLGLDLPPGWLRTLPSSPAARLVDRLLERALEPDHPSAADGLTGPARHLLRLRGHCLRMPLAPLAAHLLGKALRRQPVLAGGLQAPAAEGP